MVEYFTTIQFPFESKNGKMAKMAKIISGKTPFSLLFVKLNFYEKCELFLLLT